MITKVYRAPISIIALPPELERGNIKVMVEKKIAESAMHKLPVDIFRGCLKSSLLLSINASYNNGEMSNNKEVIDGEIVNIGIQSFKNWLKEEA